MASEGDRLNPRVFTDNVLALLDRTAAIEVEELEKITRRRQQEFDRNQDRAFLEYTTAVTKATQAAQVRESLQPFSADARSRYDEIAAMLNLEGARAADAGAASGTRGKRQGGGAVTGQGGGRHASTKPANSAVAIGDDFSGGDGFAVDSAFAIAFNGGVPMKEAPPPPSHSERVAVAIDMLSHDYDDDDDGADPKEPADWAVSPKSAAGSPTHTIGRRAIATSSKPPPSLADPRTSAAGEQIKVLMSPPPSSASYCHELAHLFNMLDSNNIVLVVTEEVPKLRDGPPEYHNKLVVLSPTNGMRLRQHLDTPADETRLLYTSHGWCVRKELLGAILQGRIDFEYVARIQEQLEKTFYCWKRSEALLNKKDLELARCKSMLEVVTRSTETLVERNRMRRLLLVQLALALKDASGTARQQQEHQQQDQQQQRGAVLADFILRSDGSSALEEERLLGSMSGGAQPVAFSSFAELQEALTAFEESKAKHPSQQVGHAIDHQETSTWGAAPQLDGASYGHSFAPPPTLLHGELSITSPTMGAGGGRHMPTQRSFAGGFGGSSAPSNQIQSLMANRAHESLIRTLQRKVEMAQRRRNFERRMEHMERLAMEGEDTISAVNTIFRFGEAGYARVRDLFNSIPSNVLAAAAKGRSTLHHVPLAAEGTTVICPCCKFDFDPSKPASYYRDAILQRQKKAREAMASKAAGAGPPAGLQQLHRGGGGRNGGKSVVPGNQSEGKGKNGGGNPPSGSGSSTAAPDEATVFAVMALQESLEEAQKQSKELEGKCAELEAGIELANLNAAAATQRAEKVTEELTKSNDELQKKASEAQQALLESSKARDVAESSAKQLKVKLANMEKAAEHAFEELELRQAVDRRVVDLHRETMLDSEAKDGNLTWEAMAKSLYRRVEELTTQIRRYGGEPIDMVDVYCGPVQKMLQTVSRLAQYDAFDTGVPPIEFESRETQIAVISKVQSTQRTPRAALVHAEAQTHGTAVVTHALLNSERKQHQDSEWKTAQGDDVKNVLIRRDIYNLLLKSSDSSDMMRDYIRQLEKKDKEDQDAHQRELTELTKAHERVVKALREDVQTKAEALEKTRATLETKKSEAAASAALADQLKGQVIKLRQSSPPEVAVSAVETPLPVPRELNLDERKARGLHTLIELQDLLDAGLLSPPSTWTATSPPLPDARATGGEVTLPFEQVYRPAGIGRAVIRRINAFTTTELEVLEASVRQELESQYAAFTIPMPMLLALLYQMKRDVGDIIAAGDRRGRAREERIVQAVNVAQVLLGGELGVGHELPSWYNYSTASPKRGDTREDESPARAQQPKSYSVLESRAFEMPEPSRRDPVTGEWIRDRDGAARAGGAHVVAAASYRSADGAPPSFRKAQRQSHERRRDDGTFESDNPHLLFNGNSIGSSMVFPAGHVRTQRPEAVVAALLRQISASLQEHDDLDIDTPRGQRQQHAPDTRDDEGGVFRANGIGFTTRPAAVSSIVVDGSHLQTPSDAVREHQFQPERQPQAADRQRQLDAIRIQRLSQVPSGDVLAALAALIGTRSPANLTTSTVALPSPWPDSPRLLRQPRQATEGFLPAVRYAEGEQVDRLDAALGVRSLTREHDGVEGKSTVRLDEAADANSRRLKQLALKNALESGRLRQLRRSGAPDDSVDASASRDGISGSPPPRLQPLPQEAVPRQQRTDAAPQAGSAPRRAVGGGDVMAHARSAVLATSLSAGVTGATKGSIAVRRPLARPTSLTPL